MAYFTPKFNTFFKELAANNHKDWLDENRKTYHQEVKDPFYKLVLDLIDEIGKRENLDLEVKNAVFRINNDIRFNKERPLYKLHVGAAIQQGGRKNFNNAGMYIHLSPGDSFIGGGIYKPDKQTLTKLRKGIAENLETFQKLYSSDTFKKYFGAFGASKVNKVLPKELKEAAQKEPLLFNQQFYFMKSFPEGEELVLREDLFSYIMELYSAMKPMKDFLQSTVE